jgi:hypothetical protein
MRAAPMTSPGFVISSSAMTRRTILAISGFWESRPALQRHNLSALLTRHRRGDALADHFAQRAHRLGGAMDVATGGRKFAMAQQVAKGFSFSPQLRPP